MTVMWRYFEKDRYHPAWVKFSFSTQTIPDPLSDQISQRRTIKEELKQYRGTLAGWEVMFETEQDLTMFLLRFS